MHLIWVIHSFLRAGLTLVVFAFVSSEGFDSLPCSNIINGRQFLPESNVTLSTWGFFSFRGEGVCGRVMSGDIPLQHKIRLDSWIFSLSLPWWNFIRTSSRVKFVAHLEVHHPRFIWRYRSILLRWEFLQLFLWITIIRIVRFFSSFDSLSCFIHILKYNLMQTLSHRVPEACNGLDFFTF